MSTLAVAPHPAARDAAPHPLTRTAFRLAAVAALLTVAGGAVNSATGSGFACPAWPGCYPGHFGPEAELHPLIEFGHRVVAASTGVLVLVAAILSRGLPRSERPARLLPWWGLTGVAGSAIFGMLTVLDGGIARQLSLLDLFCALSTMVAMVLATQSLERGAPRWRWTPASRLAVATVAGVVLLHESGTWLAGQSSFTSVLGWPLWRMVAIDRSPALQLARMALAVALLACLVLLALTARRHPARRRVAAALVVLLLVEQVSGQLVATLGVQTWLVTAYAACAAGILFTATVLAGHAGLDAAGA